MRRNGPRFTIITNPGIKIALRRAADRDTQHLVAQSKAAILESRFLLGRPVRNVWSATRDGT